MMGRLDSSKQRAAAGKTSAAQHRPKAAKRPRQQAAVAAEPRKRPRRTSAAQQQHAPDLDVDLDTLGLEQLADADSEYDPAASSEDERADDMLADLDGFEDIQDESDQEEAPHSPQGRRATGSAR
jgi:hypothetical protein